jgi:hypothetical protein
MAANPAGSLVPRPEVHPVHVGGCHAEERPAYLPPRPDAAGLSGPAMRRRTDDPNFYAPDRRQTRWLVMVIIILAGILIELLVRGYFGI